MLRRYAAEAIQECPEVDVQEDSESDTEWEE